MRKLDKLMAYDVDQTLNDGLVGLHLTHYNKILNLGMSSADIKEANATYAKVFDVPQIKEYRDSNKAQFDEARKFIRESREVNMAFDAMPGAVTGVRLLSALSNNNGYFTVRPQVNGMKETTVDWLKLKGFPNAEATIVCKDPADKIARVLNASSEVGLPAVLIDDSLGGDEGLMAAAAMYSPQDLLGKLTFVGFGMDTRKAQSIREAKGVSSGVEVIGLKSWQASLVEGLIGQLAG